MGVKTTISGAEILNLLIIYELLFCENILPALDLRVKVLKIFYLLNRTSTFSLLKSSFPHVKVCGEERKTKVQRWTCSSRKFQSGCQIRRENTERM